MDERRKENLAYEYLCHLEEAKVFVCSVHIIELKTANLLNLLTWVHDAEMSLIDIQCLVKDVNQSIDPSPVILLCAATVWTELNPSICSKLLDDNHNGKQSMP